MSAWNKTAFLTLESDISCVGGAEWEREGGEEEGKESERRERMCICACMQTFNLTIYTNILTFLKLIHL